MSFRSSPLTQMLNQVKRQQSTGVISVTILHNGYMRYGTIYVQGGEVAAAQYFEYLGDVAMQQMGIETEANVHFAKGASINFPSGAFLKKATLT